MNPVEVLAKHTGHYPDLLTGAFSNQECITPEEALAAMEEYAAYKWVRVEDGLPKVNGEYLICPKKWSGFPCAAEYIKGRDEEWLVANYGTVESDYLRSSQVECWMPLPKKPLPPAPKE